MTDLAAIKAELRTLLDGLSPTQWADAAVAFTRAVGGEPHDAGLRFFEGVVALLAATPSVERPSEASIAEIAAGLTEIGTGGTPAYIRGYNRGYDDAFEHAADTPSVEPPVGRKPTARRRHAQRLFDAARPSVEPEDEDFPPGFFLRPETLNKLRESIPADWLRPSVEPLDADILGMALDLVDEEDMRVGVVGRGRKVDRVVAEYNRLLPTQASDSPEKP